MTDADNPQADQPTTPAGALNADTNGQDGDRFDQHPRFIELNNRMKKAEAEVEKARKAEEQRQKEHDQAERQKQIEAGEFEKVLNDLRPKAERAERLETFIRERFNVLLETVPEEFRDLIPAGDVEAQWTWLDTAFAKGVFKKPAAPNLNAGELGERGAVPPPNPDTILKKRAY